MALGTLWEPFGRSLGILGKALEAFRGLWGALGAFFGEVFSGEGMLHDFCSILSNFRRISDLFLSQTVSKT